MLECRWRIVGPFQLVWPWKYAIYRTGFFVITPELARRLTVDEFWCDHPFVPV